LHFKFKTLIRYIQVYNMTLSPSQENAWYLGSAKLCPGATAGSWQRLGCRRSSSWSTAGSHRFHPLGLSFGLLNRFKHHNMFHFYQYNVRFWNFTIHEGSCTKSEACSLTSLNIQGEPQNLTVSHLWVTLSLVSHALLFYWLHMKRIDILRFTHSKYRHIPSVIVMGKSYQLGNTCKLQQLICIPKSNPYVAVGVDNLLPDGFLPSSAETA